MLGISRGGEAALLLGVHYPQLVHGVVSCEGSFETGPSTDGTDSPSWTFQGEPIVPGTTIPVEKINGPVLAFGARDDLVWDSADSARLIAERGKQHGRTDILDRIFPNAGHGAGCATPNIPHGYIRANSITYPLGGTAAGNAAAAAVGWPMLIHFLTTTAR